MQRKSVIVNIYLTLYIIFHIYSCLRSIRVLLLMLISPMSPLVRNMIMMNTKHCKMNKNISFFFNYFVSIQMKFLAMFFILLLCGVGPSYEKFFIVGVNDNSVNKSDTLSEGRQSYCFINMCKRRFSQESE